MLAYHFTSLDTARKILAGRRLRISRIDDLNDPYELLGADLGEESLRDGYIKMRDELALTRGIICFSRSFALPIMWSHYADRHRGICLAFDIPDTHAFSVIYADDRVSFVREMLGKHDSQKHMERFLGTKHSAWSYENELRLWCALENEESGHFFQPFDKTLQLREVLVGVRCSSATLEEMRNAVARIDSRARVSPTRLSNSTFEVVCA